MINDRFYDNFNGFSHTLSSLFFKYFMLSADSLATKACGPAPKIANTTALESDNASLVTYICDEGFVQTGSDDRSVCDQTTGTWTQPDITCSLVDCGNPPKVTGATVGYSF